MDPCETPLESLLDQAIDEFKLRDILAEYGIPSDEIVEIELSIENRVIATCNVPLGDNKASAEGSYSPLPGLRDRINIFLDKGQEKFKLLEQIDGHKAPLSPVKVTLNIGKKLVGRVKIPVLALASYHGILHPCPHPIPVDEDSYCAV